MRKFNLLFILLFLISCAVQAQEKKIKNVILMIPDGTSLAAFSSARWYQWYNNPDKPNLNIDPYICGTVFTFSSNDPIGDSAPTTSCYMTGVPSRAGYVSTYPVADRANDILPVDPLMAYQPLMTLLEASKVIHGKSTGLVFTCEFPHATPADCSAHTYNRDQYEWIVPQMAHNDIDVVIGGGVSFLDTDSKNYLLKEGYGIYLDNMAGFRSHQGNKMWSLFCDKDMPFDLDRDTAKYPSLEEMTAKAIEKLSANEQGFFLMVEGSKVDWAAHANDPVAMITDLLAFDKACGVAFDFAKQNGETIVIMVSDHGNSGISIGTEKCKGYSSMTKDDLFKNVSQFKVTAESLVKSLHDTPPDEIKDLFIENMAFELSDDEINRILECEDYTAGSLSNEQRMKGTEVKKVVSDIMNDHTCFGFTTNGHTGEEVLLAIYDPSGNRLNGFVRNTDLHEYMAKSLGLQGMLPTLTQDYFAKHTELFKEKEYKYSFNKSKYEMKLPFLEVTYKKNKLTVYPFSNVVKVNNRTVYLNSVVVYVDKNETFYLPKSVKDLLH